MRVRDDAADRGAARCDGSKVNMCTRKIRLYLNNTLILYLATPALNDGSHTHQSVRDLLLLVQTADYKSGHRGTVATKTRFN